MKRKRIRWFLLAGFTVFGISAAAYLLRPSPLEVETSRVECGAMQVTVSGEGRTRVRDRFVVSTPVEGNLGRVEVKEGHSVKRGAILTWLAPALLEVRSERQRQGSLQVAEAEEQAAEAQAARARVELEQATRELKRISDLVEHGIRPRQDLEAAETAQAGAREALSAATFAAGAAASHIEEIRSTLLKGDRHAIPVRSPVEGVVLRITQQSERIVPAGTPVAVIGDPRKLELLFEILSTDAVRVKPGAAVIVQNWGGEEALSASVRLIEPGAFTKISALGVEEQRVNVIADFIGESPLAGDGYRIEGEIVVWESRSAVQVPVSALFRSGTEWQVFVVENGRALVRTVQIGHRNQKNGEVLRGLAKGEVVILYPDDRLTRGQWVKTVLRN
jgi:HlyD family secretion protein